MNDTEKAANYYRAAMAQQRPDWVPCRVRLMTRVKGDFPFHGTFQDAGEHDCECNQWGAVSVKATNGQMLGVKPAEFEVVAWRPN